jgi:general secretion pathway protein F
MRWDDAQVFDRTVDVSMRRDCLNARPGLGSILPDGFKPDGTGPMNPAGWGGDMPQFRFEAVNRTGTSVRGTLDAPTRGLALDRLLASGQTPISLQSADDTASLGTQIARVFGLGAFDYVLFLRELGLLLKAGLTVERALVVLEGLSPNATQAVRVGQLLERVRGGEPLSHAIGTVIGEAPAYVARLMAAGEASGKLPQVAARLASGLTRTRGLRDKLISNLTYPAVLATTMIIVLYVVFTSVLPRLTPMFQAAGAALPLPTKLLLGVGNFVQAYGIPLLALLAIAMGIFIYAWRRPDLRLRIDRVLMTSKVLLGLPVSYEAARYCRNLETLLEGGLPLDRALAAAQGGASNGAFRVAMENVRAEVANGEPLRRAFARARMLPRIVVEFAAVGEESGRLGAMIGEAADVLDQDLEKRLDRLSALVVPAATLIMGGLVAAIMTGIVTGVLAVNDLVR